MMLKREVVTPDDQLRRGMRRHQPVLFEPGSVRYPGRAPTPLSPSEVLRALAVIVAVFAVLAWVLL